jgi:hypothetical protein
MSTAVNPATGTSPLQDFYREAYFVKSALENRSVRATILPMLNGGDDEAEALLTQIKLCITNLDLAYKNSFNQSEHGADLGQARTLEEQKRAKALGEIQANSEFRINAFEKTALPFVDSVLLGVWNFLTPSSKKKV